MEVRTPPLQSGIVLIGGGRKAAYIKGSEMSVLDFTKATVVCGLAAYLVYTFPVLSQALMIGLLSVLWLLYARKMLQALRRR